MKSKYIKPGALAAVAFTVAVTMTLPACGKKEDSAAETKQAEHADDGGLKLSAEDAQRAGIKLESITAQPMADTVTVTATIRANQDRLARVAPRVEGRVVSVQTKLGDSVKAGQALATLDSQKPGAITAMP